MRACDLFKWMRSAEYQTHANSHVHTREEKKQRQNKENKVNHDHMSVAAIAFDSLTASAKEVEP